MSSNETNTNASFGKLFLVFSLILLLALFFISMQTSVKNKDEHEKKLEIDMSSKLDTVISDVSERGFIWNSLSEIIEIAQKNGVDSNLLNQSISDYYTKTKIKANFFFYKHNNFIKGFNASQEDLDIFNNILLYMSYSEHDPKFTEANRKIHKILMQKFGTGHRLELLKFHEKLLTKFQKNEKNQYYYWNNYPDGLGVFFYTSEIPDFIERFKLSNETEDKQYFGAIDSKNTKIIPPKGMTEDQTLMAYIKSTKSNNTFVNSNDYQWYFQTNLNSEKYCYALPISKTQEDFFDWASLVENAAAILFIITLAVYLTSLFDVFPGKQTIIFLDNISIRYRIMGIFSMASIFPVIIAFIVGNSALEDKKTVIEKAIFTESLAGIYNLESQSSVVLKKTELMSKDIREALKYAPPTKELLYKYLDKYSLNHKQVRLDVRDSDIKTLFTLDDREIHSVAETMDLICRIVLKLHNPERLNSKGLHLSPGEIVSESILSTDQLGLASLVRQRNKLWLFKVAEFPTTWYWDIYPELATGPAFVCVTTQMSPTFTKHIKEYLRVSHVSSDSLQLATYINSPYFKPLIYPVHENLPKKQLLDIANTANETNKVLFRTINIAGKPYWITAKHETVVGAYVFLHLISQQERLKALEPFKLQLIIGGFFALIISLIGALFITNLIILPVGDLSNGISAIRKRIKNFSIPVRRKDEFGQLANAFNNVIGELDELEYGKFIQESLLPKKAIEIDGYDIAYFNISATDLAGDYHDDAKLDDGRSVIILGDVSGHGISASLAMAMAKATFNYAKSKKAKFPEEVMDILNTMINKELKPRNKLMTLISVVINPETNEATFDNGGQSYPCYYSAETKQCEEIIMPSLPLGGMKKRKHKAITKVMQPGDAFILYTDGMIECSSETGEMFGYERFYKKFTELMNNNTSAKDTLAAFYQAFEDFREPGPRADDVTMIVVKKL